MRIFLLWLVTLFSVASQAATITQEEAKAKAERLLGKKMMGVQMACARANHVQESPTYYLFNSVYNTILVYFTYSTISFNSFSYN